MGACMHVPGVFCDNCKTGLTNLPHTLEIKAGTGLMSWQEALGLATKRDRRERIATAAMQGMLASVVAERISWPGLHKDVARDALRFADALIAEIDSEDKP